MTVYVGGMVLDGLDGIWDQANEFVNTMPDALIEEHKPRLAALFKIHAMTMMGEIEKRIPGAPAERPLAFLRETLERIEKGDLREALRDLALGVVAIAPPSATRMDPAFEGLFNRTDDKSIALIESVERNGVGIMPMTLRLLFKSGAKEPETFYRENLGWVFPKPEGITVVAP